MSNGLSVLEKSIDHLAQLAHSMGYELVPSQPSNNNLTITSFDVTRNSCEAVSVHSRLATAQAWMRAMAIRKTAMRQTSAADPEWNILLDLYVNQLRSRPVSITGACIASDVAATTGLRYVSALEHRGLIKRNADANDARRSFVELSDEGVRVIETALDAAVESDRRLGLERLRFAK